MPKWRNYQASLKKVDLYLELITWFPPIVSFDNYHYYCDRRREFAEMYHP